MFGGSKDVLRAGMVISVEPAVFIKEERIGVRLIDNCHRKGRRGAVAHAAGSHRRRLDAKYRARNKTQREYQIVRLRG